MRSLFAASAIMLMVFIYIEISSGMDPGEKKKGKGKQIFGKVLRGKPKKQPRLIMVENEYGDARIHNEATGDLANRWLIGSEPQEGRRSIRQLEALAPMHMPPVTILPDKEGKAKAFHHHLLRFDGDPPYKPGSDERSHAVLLQMGHNLASDLKQKAPLPVIPESTWILETDDHGRERLVPRAAGRFADEPLDEQHHASGGYEANLHHQLQNSLHVSPPSLRQASESGFNPYQFNEGYHNLWDQQGYPYVNAQHPGQGSVVGNDPYHFIQGHDGQYQATPRLPLNTQFSGSSALPSNRGFQGPYGPGHQA